MRFVVLVAFSMKSSSSFVCESCGYETPQWYGKCPECGEWNTLKEFQISNFKSQISKNKTQEHLKPQKLSDVKFEEKVRLSTGFSEADSVLGGGIVKGSVVLLAGDPGVGKSTLLLQIALNLASQKVPKIGRISADKNTKNVHPKTSSASSTSTTFSTSVLYVSGEESEQQIKYRAERLGGQKDPNLLLLSSTDIDSIASLAERENPSLLIIDSIQTMTSENLQGLAGSVGQVRYSTFQLIKVAKGMGIPVVMIGHVTKEGMVAGPMVLSHMVDTVLFLEGEKSTQTRILRSFKNRFGPVDEVGIFVMEEKGLVEVTDPSNFFLTKADSGQVLTGSVLTSTVEGTKPLIVEIQALSISSKLPMPRRIASGVDPKRLELLLSVLQKHVGIPTYSLDIYVNVAGGFKVSDPATDLAVCLAIVSSYRSIPTGKTVAIGEVGLLGELRGVTLLDKRIREAKKLGMSKIITSVNFKTLRDAVVSLGQGTGENT